MRNKYSSSFIQHHVISSKRFCCVWLFIILSFVIHSCQQTEFLTQMCHRRPNLMFIYFDSDVTNGLRQSPPSATNKNFMCNNLTHFEPPQEDVDWPNPRLG